MISLPEHRRLLRLYRVEVSPRALGASSGRGASRARIFLPITLVISMAALSPRRLSDGAAAFFLNSRNRR